MMKRVCYPYVNICGEVVEELSEHFVRVQWDDGSITVVPRYFLIEEEDLEKTHEISKPEDKNR